MHTLFSAQYHSAPGKPAQPAEVELRPEGLVVRVYGQDETERWPSASLIRARILPDGAVLLEHDEKRYLVVADGAFQDSLDRFFPKRKLFHRGFFDRKGMQGCLLLAGTALIPLLFAVFFLGPWLVKKIMDQIPPQKETEIGKQMFHNLVEAEKIDTLRTRLAQQFLDSLNYSSKYPLEVTVVHESVLNAFALPGGPIVVFDSLLNTLEHPAEFAALLAHEASHIEYRHSTRKLLNELGIAVLLGVLFGNSGDIAGLVGQQGANLASLSYSRNLEREADDRGLALMVGRGIPPEGLPALLERLKAAEQEGGSGLSFLASHPATSERIEKAKAEISRIADKQAQIPPVFDRIWENLNQ